MRLIIHNSFISYNNARRGYASSAGHSAADPWQYPGPTARCQHVPVRERAGVYTNAPALGDTNWHPDPLQPGGSTRGGGGAGAGGCHGWGF